MTGACARARVFIAHGEYAVVLVMAREPRWRVLNVYDNR